jgi:hypothetical protein
MTRVETHSDGLVHDANYEERSPYTTPAWNGTTRCGRRFYWASVDARRPNPYAEGAAPVFDLREITTCLACLVSA